MFRKNNYKSFFFKYHKSTFWIVQKKFIISNKYSIEKKYYIILISYFLVFKKVIRTTKCGLWRQFAPKGTPCTYILLDR